MAQVASQQQEGVSQVIQLQGAVASALATAQAREDAAARAGEQRLVRIQSANELDRATHETLLQEVHQLASSLPPHCPCTEPSSSLPVTCPVTLTAPFLSHCPWLMFLSQAVAARTKAEASLEAVRRDTAAEARRLRDVAARAEAQEESLAGA